MEQASIDAEVIWTPSEDRIARARVTHFISWLGKTRGLQFGDYQALWKWSVQDLDGFWTAVVDYFELPIEGQRQPALAVRAMPHASWFPATKTNYVLQIFKNSTPDHPAITFLNEEGMRDEVSWKRLESEVAALAQWMRDQGVQSGDRVAAFLPNVPHAVVAFFATASIGAIWTMCSSEMGATAVVERFRQIEPKILIAADGYRWGGKSFDRTAVVTDLLKQLPSVEKMVLVPNLDRNALAAQWPEGVDWHAVTRPGAPLRIDLQPFDHPLWIVYSSGTTGLPKPIVHGHGGILLEHVKSMAFHNDVARGDRFHWFTTTGWVTWNLNVAVLLLGATMCIYDGNPAWPDYSTLWKYADEMELDLFGAGAAFFSMCEKNGIEPKDHGSFRRLRTIGSTGSPLSDSSYRWIYGKVSRDIWLSPMSGGTDIAGSFVGGLPTVPVVVGEMQVRCLGMDVQSWDADGQALIDEVGELVCVSPLPSMPLYFWNDQSGARYTESYFDTYPGVWRHGDWLRVTKRGGAVIYGRSDATINRHGVRMGTSELYRVIEELPEVLDSLVVDIEYLGKESYMPLFVALRPGMTMDGALAERIKHEVRTRLSSRHIPNDVIQVSQIPRTLTGKKLEIPVKKLLLGHSATGIINRDTMANPDSLDWFIDFARKRLAA